MKTAVRLMIIGMFFLGLSRPVLSAFQEKKSSLRFSFSHRFRFVSWDNAIHLDPAAGSNSTFTRHRTSLGAIYNPEDWFELSLKLTNEFRAYITPGDRKFNLNEVFVDNFYLKFLKPGGLPMTATLGRQNIMLGEGFVVMDGHPLDGSRSIYFNGARLDLIPSKGRTLTAFYVYQPVVDDWLPVLNEREQLMIEQPEEGAGVYFSGDFGRWGIDSYLIRKNIHDTELRPVESGINALGMRVRAALSEKAVLTTEGAFQSGKWGSAGRSAFGGYFHFDYSPKKDFPIPAVLTLGGILLSGDNPATDRLESWDPLFSRWPKWSESYIYTLIPEYQGKVAYWSNLASLYGTLHFVFSERAGLFLTFFHLMAPQASSAQSRFGGFGHTRGELFISKLQFNLSKSLSGHVLWEIFSPGNFYFPGSSGFHWFRIELMYRI